jgi:peptidoglycan/LPS O-acetylase OafA/YrhL
LHVNQTISQDSPEEKTQHRFLWIDGLRGLAAISVTSFHFYHAGPLYESLSKIFPSTIDFILKHGWLGVEVFFVISGFVIAYSLREAQITFALLCNFTLRRFLRLSPPYWMTIFLVILINFASNLILTDRTTPLPSIDVIVAHAFYLQNILGMDDIVPVFWTLCLEIQFYLVLMILLGISQKLIAKQKTLFQFLTDAVFWGLAVGSVLEAISVGEAMRSFFFPYWYAFFMGVLARWTLEKKAYTIWFWLYIGTITLFLIIRWDDRLFVTLITGLSLYGLIHYQQFQYWFTSDWQQYLGKISYSLYLIHLLTGMRMINIGYRLTGNSSIMSFIWFISALVISIFSAHLFYILIEKPSLYFSRRISLKINS